MSHYVVGFDRSTGSIGTESTSTQIYWLPWYILFL